MNKTVYSILRHKQTGISIVSDTQSISKDFEVIKTGYLIARDAAMEACIINTRYLKVWYENKGR